ncbi:hypothetical protein B0H10DRAFT_1958431 [Mycena sp. CBHHK59/15]|nr:hypothetical protein B0H10DRAFT_1958431 [Mycena sp. CBHHK59/15]
MSSAVLPGLKVVDEGDDGFVIGTPEDWKALLSAGAPAEVLVSQYLRVCHLGRVLVRVGNFHPHRLQREQIPGHADSLATELLNGNNQHRQHPLTVVAQTVPCFKTIYDETPFMNADGTYTDVWTMCGNHRVGGLQLYATELKDPDAAWLCDVYHPCFLKIHDEHQRRLILIDNIASDDEMLKKPGSLRATILHALDVVIEFWRKFHLIPTEAPRLALFKGSISSTVKLGRWKLAVRILLRDRRLVSELRSLLSEHGTLAQMTEPELVEFLWNLAMTGIGAETTLYHLIRGLLMAQRGLAHTFPPTAPHLGFNIYRFWESAVPNPSVDEQHQFELALHSGNWDDLCEACPRFHEAFAVPAAQSEYQPFLAGMPSHHVACIKSGRHHYEGWAISTLAHVRTSIRVMALVFWGPQGVFLFSDPPPQSLIVSAANTAALLMTTVQNQLYLRETGGRAATGAEKARFAELLDETMQNFYTGDESRWFLPAGFWEALTFATDNALGVNAAPVSKAASVPASEYPAVARVLNRVFANQHWYDLLTKDWGILPGQPFTWEPTVRITDLTPAQAEEEAVQRDAQAELQRRRSTLLERQLALEADVAQSIDVQTRMERKVEVAQAAEAELAIKRDKRRRKAEADAALVIEAAKEVAQEAADRTARLRERVEEHRAVVDGLPELIDPRELSADELVALLRMSNLNLESISLIRYSENHGIGISRHPYVVARDPAGEEYTVPVPCATPAGHTQVQAEAEDGHLLLRRTLIEAASALSLSQLHQISRAASTLDTQSLLRSVLSELDPSPSPPTQNSDMQHYLQRNREERDASPGSTPSRAGSPQSLPPRKRPAPAPSPSWNTIRSSDSQSDHGSRRPSPSTPEGGNGKRSRMSTQSPSAARRHLPGSTDGRRSARQHGRRNRGSRSSSTISSSSEDAPPPPSDEEDEDYVQTPALRASASPSPRACQVMLVPSSSQVQDDDPIRGADEFSNATPRASRISRSQRGGPDLVPLQLHPPRGVLPDRSSLVPALIHDEGALDVSSISEGPRGRSKRRPLYPQDPISVANPVNLEQGKAGDVFGARPDDEDLMWDKVTAATGVDIELVAFITKYNPTGYSRFEIVLFGYPVLALRQGDHR